ncbi:MAG: hypothetical protein HRU28_16000 [Rhizobiales bacterium]|nr:hypothetical protein [Hyphomicrobiales bacterium]
MPKNTETTTFKYKNIINYLPTLFLMPVILSMSFENTNYIFGLLMYTTTISFTILAIYAIYRNTRADRFIIFSRDTIKLPKNLLHHRIIEINYNDIISFNYGMAGIKIIHKNGKINIDKSGIKGIGVIDKIYNLLEEKTGL